MKRAPIWTTIRTSGRFNPSRLARLAVLTIGALGLGSCVISEQPLLVSSKPVFGEAFDVTLFRDYRTNGGYSADQVHYAWRDGHYASSPTADKKIVYITAEPLTDDDLIIERTEDIQPGQKKLFSYFIARRMAQGAYLFAPVSENDLSPQDRAADCEKNAPQDFCPVTDHARLLLAAKATAEKSLSNPSIAVFTSSLKAEVFVPPSP